MKYNELFDLEMQLANSGISNPSERNEILKVTRV